MATFMVAFFMASCCLFDKVFFRSTTPLEPLLMFLRPLCSPTMLNIFKPYPFFVIATSREQDIAFVPQRGGIGSFASYEEWSKALKGWVQSHPPDTRNRTSRPVRPSRSSASAVPLSPSPIPVIALASSHVRHSASSAAM